MALRFTAKNDKGKAVPWLGAGPGLKNQCGTFKFLLWKTMHAWCLDHQMMMKSADFLFRCVVRGGFNFIGVPIEVCEVRPQHSIS